MALSISALALLQAAAQPVRTSWGTGGGWWGFWWIWIIVVFILVTVGWGGGSYYRGSRPYGRRRTDRPPPSTPA